MMTVLYDHATQQQSWHYMEAHLIDLLQDNLLGCPHGVLGVQHDAFLKKRIMRDTESQVGAKKPRTHECDASVPLHTRNTLPY